MFSKIFERLIYKGRIEFISQDSILSEVKDAYQWKTVPIIVSREDDNIKLIGETIDDSIGEAFDKCGKILGLSYPAGPYIDKMSKKGNHKKFYFTIQKQI